ncbi:MAG: hypothetical protein RMN24_07335 [Anaerolineae bacterium]|nr:hypothetical protein [Caldilineales bacterium]MCX7853644.1 hypothetical protein [Caldilineales bacterium]MDW8268961.1 hypothetical protein [Anaerolineae bacterium]
MTLPPEIPGDAGASEAEAEIYLPVDETAHTDDAESVARFPARIVRDATVLQERRWGANVPVPEGEGQD